jgi:hypothetical protein
MPDSRRCGSRRRSRSSRRRPHPRRPRRRVAVVGEAGTPQLRVRGVLLGLAQVERLGFGPTIAQRVRTGQVSRTWYSLTSVAKPGVVQLLPHVVRGPAVGRRPREVRLGGQDAQAHPAALLLDVLDDEPLVLGQLHAALRDCSAPGARDIPARGGRTRTKRPSANCRACRPRWQGARARGPSRACPSGLPPGTSRARRGSVRRWTGVEGCCDAADSGITVPPSPRSPSPP